MPVVTRINIKQTANTIGLLYIYLSLIFVIPMTIITLATAKDKLSALMFVLLPLFYGAVGWLGIALFSWFYNLAAKKTGGISLKIKK